MGYISYKSFWDSQPLTRDMVSLIDFLINMNVLKNIMVDIQVRIKGADCKSVGESLRRFKSCSTNLRGCDVKEAVADLKFAGLNPYEFDSHHPHYIKFHNRLSCRFFNRQNQKESEVYVYGYVI